MSARTLVAAALGEVFPDFDVIETFTAVGEREPGDGTFLQVFSDGFLPSEKQGILRARFKVWLCISNRDANEVEDELEQLLPMFYAALEQLDWLVWNEIKPGIHPDNYYGYEAEIITETDPLI